MASNFTENLQTRVSKHFEKVNDDPNNFYFKCLISDNCGKHLNAKKRFNLVNHAKTHKEFFRMNFEIEPAVLLTMSAQRLHYIQCCAEFVTVNGEPFSALNKSGFRRLNSSKLQNLKNAGFADGLDKKCTAVKQHIRYLSSEIINEIKKEVKGIFVSLMVDTATKYRRSILGISLQFLRGSSIVIRSIGMMHLTSSHSARYIADKIFDQLNFFDIKISQIISITTDNASNMKAMINRCNDAYNEDCDSDDTDTSDSADETEENHGHREKTDADSTVDHDNGEFQRKLEQEFISTPDEDVSALISNYLDELENEEPDCTDDMPPILADRIVDFEKLIRDLEEIFADQTLNINGIRCAAHTLQLAVIGALQASDYAILIRLCRAICKQLRKQSIIHELGKNQIIYKIPSIDCLTRWNSTYKMLRDLVDHCKAAIFFFAKKEKSPKCFKLILLKWSIITDMLEVLKLPFDVTICIQHSAYTLSDFYGNWLQMKRKIEQLAKPQDELNNFAFILLEQILKRESSLVNNSAMLAAIYLDPRYSFKLTVEEKKIAKLTLENLLERVRRAKLRTTRTQQKAVTADEDSFEEECVKSGLSRTFYGKNDSSTLPASGDSDSLFAAYEDIGRIHHKTSILQFWVEQSKFHPVMYELASIIHAIPPSQTTVERAFSVLGYIYDCRRTRLLPRTLEDILMIILNRDLVETIHQRDLNAIS